MSGQNKASQANEQLPPGAIRVGNQIRYPDSQGDLHKNPQEAIRSNMRIESDYSRGASGGCGQDPENIPYQGDFGIGSDR